MPDTKLDADLQAYEDRHERLEAFLASVRLLCNDFESREWLGTWMYGRVPVDDLRAAMEGL